MCSVHTECQPHKIDTAPSPDSSTAKGEDVTDDLVRTQQVTSGHNPETMPMPLTSTI